MQSMQCKRYAIATLKIKSFHDVNFVVTGVTGVVIMRIANATIDN